MEYRNVKRWFLMGKALRKFNKKRPFEITQKRLALLCVVYYMEQHRYKTTASNINRYLNNLGRSMDWRNMHRMLQELEAAFLLQKNDAIYRLTVEGRLALQQIEAALRKERFEK